LAVAQVGGQEQKDNREYRAEKVCVEAFHDGIIKYTT
jgi:hypothetical protein